MRKRCASALVAVGVVLSVGVVRSESPGGKFTRRPPVPGRALAARIDSGTEIIGIVHWGLNTYTEFGGDRPFENARLLGFCVRSINYRT